MAREGTFSYTAAGSCDLPTAMALLSDLTRQGELHPLIIGVEPLAVSPGAVASYAITDRLTIGPIAFRIRYFADVLAVTSDDIRTVARQSPATTVTNHTHVAATRDGVTVAVDVTLRAPTLLFAYAFRTARTAHLALGERISARLDELARP